MTKHPYKTFEASDLMLDSVFVMNAQLTTPEGFPEGEMNYDFNVLPEVLLFVDNARILIRLVIKGIMTPIDTSTTSESASFELDLRFVFAIKDLENYTTLIDKQWDLSPDLAISSLSIAYSTARGICLSRFQNTVFGLAFLPILSPNQLLQLSNLKPRELMPPET